jgi:antitoxin (DNA-binding transcriptional repressor) of toxin-antitoxin stability system
MESLISATQLARRISDILNRVVYRGEAFVVERGGIPVCRIQPVGPTHCTLDDFIETIRSAPKPDQRFWDDLEEIGKTQPRVQDARW